MLPERLLPPLGQQFLIDTTAQAVPVYPDWIGNPEPAYESLHQICPVNRVRDAINQILVEPVRADSYRGGCYATVLGVYLFSLEDAGTLLTWRWTAGGPVPVSEHELALQRIVREPDWLTHNAGLLGSSLFASTREQASQSVLSAPVPPTTRAYAQWLLGKIAAALLTPQVIEQTQQRLQQALGLNNHLLSQATRLPARFASRQGATVGDYNLLIASGVQIEQIRQDSPLIADLYPLFCDAPTFASSPESALEPAAAMRQFLLGHGIDQATWRALCAMGSKPLEPLLALYDAPRDKAMLDLLGCLNSLRIREASQLWALAHLFSTFGAHGTRPIQYLKSIDGDPVLIHIMACAPRGMAPSAQQMDELDLVIRWAMDEHIGQPDKRQRQAGWPWLVKQATHWKSRERFRFQASKFQWAAPITAVSIDQLTFAALLNELALWDEALALHHCADAYGHRCREGAYLIYSVRRPAAWTGSAQDKRIATLALSRLGPRWQLDQLVGPANTGVDNVVEKAALTLIKLLNQI